MVAQRLRDRRWVIFVLATNDRIEALDKAVRRPGRFDYSEKIGHPVLEAQLRYVTNHRRRLTDRQREAIKDALTDWNERNGGDRRVLAQADDEDLPVVSFAVIDDVVNTIRDFRRKGTRRQASELLSDRIADIAIPPRLSRNDAEER